MSKSARTPTTTASRSQAIAVAAGRALRPVSPATAPDAEPAPARDETVEQAHASEEAMKTSQDAVKIAQDTDEISHGVAEEVAAGRVRGGILHSKRDAEKAMDEVRVAVAAFARRGVTVAIDSLDLNTLRPRAQALALCRLLVAKGVLTQEEIQYEEAVALLDMLARIYQALEEQHLQATRPVVARRGDLIVPGRN